MSAHLVAWLGVLGLALDLLGGIYLAYDLFGEQGGSLRTITRAGSYALVFTACYTAGLSIPFGPIVGIGLGLLLGIEYGLRRGETVGLAFAVARGAVFGLGGLALHGAGFGLIFGAGAAAGLVVVYRLRFSVAADYPAPDDPRIRVDVAMAQAVRAIVTAGAMVIAGVVTSPDPQAIALFAVRLAATSWVTGTVVGSTTPAVESWVDAVPTRRLGIIGVLLILVGLVIESVPDWAVIFDAPVSFG
jgi:hypothetical protein